MPSIDNATLERLIGEVLTSSKYKDVHPDLIRNVAALELQKRRSFKDALKATKNKLHQVGGAYFSGHGELESATNFASWLAELEQAAQAEDQARKVSMRIMSNHASTKERISILDQFYSSLFADLQPIHSILDLACGLNPLALPWMGLADDVEYYAYDIYEHMMDFLNQYLQLVSVQGNAQAADVLQTCPTREVDVALLLKALPCLEQVDKQAAHALLSKLNARCIIVSYPVHSLGGRSKGMVAHYETQFRELLQSQASHNGREWAVEKYSFETELVFTLKKEIAPNG
jgi:16S rRNA (guanine(1405)-N(7))-methyltransferase